MFLRKAGFALQFLLLIASGCTCDEELTRLNAAIEADPPELDFGKVARGTLIEKPMTLRNKGSITLLIEGFSAAAPFVAPPGTSSITVGGETGIMVGFRPTELGPQSGVLEITSNDPEVPVTMVPLRGEGIEAAIEVDPLTVDFGEVLWNVSTTPDTRTVTIRNPGSDAFDLTALDLVDDGAGGFTVDAMDAVKTYQPGDSGMFTVTFAPNQRGMITGAVRLMSTAPDSEEITVSLLADVVGPQLDICAAADGDAETCTAASEIPKVEMLLVPRMGTGHGQIRLMNSGNRDLTIFGYSVAGQADELSFTPATLTDAVIAPGMEQIVETAYMPQDYQFDSVITIFNSDSPPMTVGSVRVEGSVARANIESDPLTITMSLTAPSSMARVGVDLYNCGQEPLILSADAVINQLSGPAQAFRLENAPTNGTMIQPQDCAASPAPMVTFNVVFETMTNGFYEAEVPIMSNDPLDPTLTIVVSGSRN